MVVVQPFVQVLGLRLPKDMCPRRVRFSPVPQLLCSPGFFLGAKAAAPRSKAGPGTSGQAGTGSRRDARS